MKLRDQQEEVDSLKEYSKGEISDLEKHMQVEHEKELKRITEMVFHSPTFFAYIFLCALFGLWMPQFIYFL